MISGTKIQLIYDFTIYNLQFFAEKREKSDLKEKKIYIGSTYGFDGIWQRWSDYVRTNGHGGDKELKEIIEKQPEYAFENFTFSILEYFYDEDRDYILSRETKWKELLQTRVLGYNAN